MNSRPGKPFRLRLLDTYRNLLERNADGTALSGRLWPVLFSIAENGKIGPYEVP